MLKSVGANIVTALSGILLSINNFEQLSRRVVDGNVWLGHGVSKNGTALASLPIHGITPEVMPTEEAVGRAMLKEIENLAASKDGDLVIILLGGRGAQAL